MSKDQELDTFTQAYLETALWASGLDDMTIDELEPDEIADAIQDCADFRQAVMDDTRIRVHLLFDDEAAAGHNFWLTRNRHGAGFWDGDYPEPDATILTDLAHSYGEVELSAYLYRYAEQE